MDNIISPYYRIIRPRFANPDGLSFNYHTEHYFDNRYCAEKHSLLHSFYIIINDFKKLFDYIEFHDANKDIFSHRIYELYLRTCTEFENNCKGILKANNYNTTRSLTIQDYFKLNKAMKLDEYQVKISIWSPQPLITEPFKDWQNANEFTPLGWYRDYNQVKHNRSEYFHLASLKNLTKSITGLFSLLAAQFHSNAFHQFQRNMFGSNDDDGFFIVQESLFGIKFPHSWVQSDFYDFEWEELKNIDEPFRRYNFN
ncbi:hypothetical protein ACFOWU_09505 [Epilithonimonas zeae]|uniref:Uncharacterized protein n=1 Tax=Epilithonimonas zeae TaxID=1416779 RepID=A0A1N6GQD8_9FLAO|nr:hypothetical protein [Epilithonimonas zeae]SIO09687.1 hypothetical protein SAMN05444409_1983 [Epilithonimonas zeae]